MNDVERGAESRDLDREAKWVENWWSWDFSWRGRSERAYLVSHRVEVPASFPDGTAAKGPTKIVSLKDYWRWSLGLPGKERLLTDEELLAAGLLIEVGGEWFHLFHAPDIHTKRDTDGEAIRILQEIIRARLERMLPRPGADEHRPRVRQAAVPLTGGWLPGSLMRLGGTSSDLGLDFCRLFDVDLTGETVGRLRCCWCLLSGDARFARAAILGEANFEGAVFSGTPDFFETTFTGKVFWSKASFAEGVNFRRATFGAEVDFYGVTFQAFASFEQASFGSHAHFEHATFSGGASFDQALFRGILNFQSAQFLKEVSLLIAVEN